MQIYITIKIIAAELSDTPLQSYGSLKSRLERLSDPFIPLGPNDRKLDNNSIQKQELQRFIFGTMYRTILLTVLSRTFGIDAEVNKVPVSSTRAVLFGLASACLKEKAPSLLKKIERNRLGKIENKTKRIGEKYYIRNSNEEEPFVMTSEELKLNLRYPQLSRQVPDGFPARKEWTTYHWELQAHLRRHKNEEGIDQKILEYLQNYEGVKNSFSKALKFDAKMVTGISMFAPIIIYSGLIATGNWAFAGILAGWEAIPMLGGVGALSRTVYFLCMRGIPGIMKEFSALRTDFFKQKTESDKPNSKFVNTFRRLASPLILSLSTCFDGGYLAFPFATAAAYPQMVDQSLDLLLDNIKLIPGIIRKSLSDVFFKKDLDQAKLELQRAELGPNASYKIYDRKSIEVNKERLIKQLAYHFRTNWEGDPWGEGLIETSQVSKDNFDPSEDRKLSRDKNGIFHLKDGKTANEYRLFWSDERARIYVEKLMNRNGFELVTVEDDKGEMLVWLITYIGNSQDDFDGNIIYLNKKKIPNYLYVDTFGRSKYSLSRLSFALTAPHGSSYLSRRAEALGLRVTLMRTHNKADSVQKFANTAAGFQPTHIKSIKDSGREYWIKKNRDNKSLRTRLGFHFTKYVVNSGDKQINIESRTGYMVKMFAINVLSFVRNQIAISISERVYKSLRRYELQD